MTCRGCFVVLVFLLQPTSGAEPCFDGCPIADDGDRFHFPNPDRSDLLLSWEDAHALCRRQGMMLPTIRSQCDQYQLSSYLHTMGVYEYDVWLGGKSKQNHEWQWLNGSQLIDYDFANQTTGHHYAYISLSPTARLDDANTSLDERKFICEYRDRRMCEEEEKRKNVKSFDDSGNKCYVPSGHALNWYNARTYCRRGGGDLATSSDVIDSFARYNSTGKEKYWVGLRQVKWRWENDEDVDMTFFRPVEVDKTGNDSDCLYSLRGEQWIWDSRPCNNTGPNSLLVICQKADDTSRTTTLPSMPPWKPDCSDNSLSWMIGTCSLIVITVFLLATVVALTLYLRRLLKAPDPEAQPKEINDAEKTSMPARDVACLNIEVEEHTSSTSLKTKIVEKKNRETPKKLLTMFPIEPDQAYPKTLPQFPVVVSAKLEDPAADYAVEIHHISEYRKQISTFSSLSYENVTSMHPIQNEVGKMAHTHPKKPKPKTAPKKNKGQFRNTCQPNSNSKESTAYDVERAVSPSLHSVTNEATANASDQSLTQQNTKKDNKRRILKDDDCENGEETSCSTPDTRCEEAVSYTNAEYCENYKKGKFATDKDGYLQPISFEKTSTSSTINEHSRATATYTNAHEMESTRHHYANEDKAGVKKKSKILSGLTRRLRKSRAKDPVSPTTFASAFRKYSATKSVSFDQSYSNVRSSKGSVHIYAEILSDEDDATTSTSQPTDGQNAEKKGTAAEDIEARNTTTERTHTKHTNSGHTSADHTKTGNTKTGNTNTGHTDTRHTNTGRTKADHTKTGHTEKKRPNLRKKLSIKKWSENDVAVGY